MIAIVTDSTCDLGPAQLAQLGVNVVPLHIRLGGAQHLDWVDIDPDALYARMQQGQIAETAPPSAEEFKRLYARLLGIYDEVISIHLSEGISETALHARQAAAELKADGRVRVLDSGYATAPLAELVLLAARLAAAGTPASEIIARVQRLRGLLRAEFTVPSLEYLRRGGRLSRTGELIGNLLNIRPILTFDGGKIVADRRVRGSGAMQDMIGRLESHFGSTPISVTIAHAGRDRERIEVLRKMLDASKLVIRQGRIQLIGAVVGAHVGPGTFGLMGHPIAEN